VSMRQLFEKIF